MNNAESIDKLRSALFAEGALPSDETLDGAAEEIKNDPKVADGALFLVISPAALRNPASGR